jgi:hypothetical protein
MGYKILECDKDGRLFYYRSPYAVRNRGVRQFAGRIVKALRSLFERLRRIG